VVTGKGGTGKTSVAAALALGLAEGGRRTLLAEVEGRQGIAQLFGTEPLPYQERKIASVPGGGEVRALAVDPEEALLEYLEMFYKMGAAGRALRKVGAIDFATTIAPGLRDVLLTGKVKEATTRARDGRRVYDAVVLKTLGATRGKLIGAYALEYLLLGSATALFGVVAGSVAAWLVVTRVMNLTFAWLPGPAAAAAFGALLVTVALGLIGTFTALGHKPATVLRNL